MSESPDDLIAALQDLAARIGKTPSVSELKEDDQTPSRYQYRKEFGTWNKAIEAAGLEKNQAYAYGTDQLLDELARLTRTLGRVPSEGDMDENGAYSAAAYRNHFDDWNAALEELDLRDERERPRDAPTERELVDYLREVANYHGVARTAQLSKRDLPDGGYSYTIYRNRFGSWHEALAAAGLPFPDQGYDRDDIIEAIQDVGSIVDKYPGEAAPTHAEFLEHGTMSTDPIKRVYGTWEDAVIDAGFDPHTGGGRPEGSNEYTTGFLLSELRRVADELHRAPTHNEFSERSDLDWKTLAHRFGSWDRAIRMIGYLPSRKSQHKPANTAPFEQRRGTLSNPSVQEITIVETEHQLSVGDILFDERSDLGYGVVSIECESKALQPDWKIYGELLHDSEEVYYRRFWVDELEDGIGEWLFKVY